MQIMVRDNNVDQALRALKKKLQREGVYREMKLRRHYEKPSEKRAREKAAAVRRARKLERKQELSAARLTCLSFGAAPASRASSTIAVCVIPTRAMTTPPVPKTAKMSGEARRPPMPVASVIRMRVTMM